MDNDRSEHYFKKGDPAAPTYYVIRRIGEAAGLLANFNMFAGYIKHALTKKYLPVIDMKNYPSACLAPELIGKENSWEYYFTQPLGITLEQAYAGENVLLCAVEDPSLYMSFNVDFFYNKNNALEEWRALVKLGLLQIQPELQREIDEIWNKLFTPNDRVLGVHMRGTDYAALKPHGHYIPPPIEFALSHIIAKINKWNCNKIFLATEDKTLVPPFKQIFGDACVMTEKVYLDYNPESRAGITMVHSDRENDYYLLGKEYVIDMALLAKCTSFISHVNNGALAVMLFNDKFEHTYFFNLGKYGVVSFDGFMDDD